MAGKKEDEQKRTRTQRVANVMNVNTERMYVVQTIGVGRVFESIKSIKLLAEKKEKKILAS